MKSDANLRSSVEAAAIEHEARARAIAIRATMVRQGEASIESFQPTMQEAVREYLVRNPAGGMTPQQLHAKHDAERREYFRARAAQGHKVHRVTQIDHDLLVSSIFDSVDRGMKPAIRPMLEAHGRQRGYDAEWANKVSARRQPRKMAKTLASKRNHPALNDLKEGQMLSQTHKAALQNATYSGLASLLFSGSQNVRNQRRLQQRMDALEAELAVVKADAARANARLDNKDAGKDWKEAARAIRAAEPSIANRELARRVGMSESTVRKYLIAL